MPSLRLLRFITSEYRLLFAFVFTLNLLGIARFLQLWMATGQPSQGTCSLAVSINLAISIIIREEHIVNLLYAICTAVPRTSPLWLRRRLGKIYHLGGLHSGCGVAGTVWFILLSIQTTWSFDFSQKRADAWVLLVATYILDALLLAMLVMAYPTIRAKLHNVRLPLNGLLPWILRT